LADHKLVSDLPILQYQLTKNMALVRNIFLDAKVEIQLANSDLVSVVALLWDRTRIL
jgi:hypothetical protein